MTDEQVYDLVSRRIIEGSPTLKAIALVAERHGLKTARVQSSYYRHRRLLNQPAEKETLKTVLERLDLIEALLNELLERSDP